MNTSEHKFWIEFEGGKLILHGKSIHVATLFLDRLVTLEDDRAIKEAIKAKFRGECIVIHMPVDHEFVDKQLIFTVPLKTPIRKENWFLKATQRDLARVLQKIREGSWDTSV